MSPFPVAVGLFPSFSIKAGAPDSIPDVSPAKNAAISRSAAACAVSALARASKEVESALVVLGSSVLYQPERSEDLLNENPTEESQYIV